MELRQEAEPVEPNNDVASATKAMAACDAKRNVGIDRVNGTKEVEKKKKRELASVVL